MGGYGTIVHLTRRGTPEILMYTESWSKHLKARGYLEGIWIRVEWEIFLISGLNK
jgi:hypothetical protein